MSRTTRQQTDAARKKTNSVVVAEQAARCYELRLTGATLREIGDQLGIAIGTVHKRLATYVSERVDPLADQYRQVELDRIDASLVRLNGLEETARKVLGADHLVVSEGRVVQFDGVPLRDYGPVLQAIDRLVKIEEARRKNSEHRAKLLGLNAAVKVDAQIHQVDPADIELNQMIREAQAKAKVEEARLRGEATQ